MKEIIGGSGFKKRLLIFIILLVVSIIIVVPYIWMLSNSFKTTMETLTDPMHIIPQDPTMAGYEKVLTKSPFFKWLWNSCFVTGINTIVILFTSSIVGYIFARFEFKGRNFLFAMLVFTMMVPAQVTMITTFIIIDGVGLYNSVWALIIPSFVNVFGIYLCKQYCEEIPRELIESAKIDGAGNFRIYWNIVIPQIRPALGALAIFTFLEYWNDYLNPLIYLSSTDNMTLPLALSYFSTQHSTDLSATMAASALIMIPAAIVFIIFQKQFIKGLALTGMK
ncbi:MAG: carbohydrate ABC transporter permease [Firmicutes bacterium]|nr:carbohydrate ABC transporter permease [Bacillota bacterium]MBQ3964113.1 carbohydrate ABC transporter permease [Bacillota bacterium]MCR5134018.1 carbohydrate ABC transporter permease [Clostridiales bacterium]